MIEIHEVLMTEYVYILYSYTLYAKKKKINKIKNAVIFNQKG